MTSESLLIRKDDGLRVYQMVYVYEDLVVRHRETVQGVKKDLSKMLRTTDLRHALTLLGWRLSGV